MEHNNNVFLFDLNRFTLLLTHSHLQVSGVSGRLEMKQRETITSLSLLRSPLTLGG